MTFILALAFLILGSALFMAIKAFKRSKKKDEAMDDQKDVKIDLQVQKINKQTDAMASNLKDKQEK